MFDRGAWLRHLAVYNGSARSGRFIALFSRITESFGSSLYFRSPSSWKDEGHQSGPLGEELLPGRVLYLGAEFGDNAEPESRRGVAGRPGRHERLLLETEGAGTEHPAEQIRQPDGDPAARHRLYFRSPDRPGRTDRPGHAEGPEGETPERA